MDVVMNNIPVVLVATVPATLWLLAIASRDRFEPEPARQLLIYFALGAFAVLLVAFVINTLAIGLVGMALVVGAIAPVVEETGKVGITWLRGRRDRHFNELVDGMIYGSAVGLGFAAGENVKYVIDAFYASAAGGPDPVLSGLLMTAPIRALTATIMHALATGIGGYYIALHLKAGASRSTALLGLGGAILLHAVYNSVQLFNPLLLWPVLAVGGWYYVRLFRRALAASPFVNGGAVDAETGAPCTSCGQPIPSVARHCPHCGAAVAVASPVASQPVAG